MTDRRARQTGDHRIVEVELSGGEPPAPARSSSAETATAPRRSRRHSIGLTAAGALVAGGVVVAIVAAIATAGDGDAAIEGTPTTLDASRITTPPTLPDRQTLPPIPASTSPPISPDRTDAQPRFDPTTVTVPAFDVVSVASADELDAYDLLGAIAANSTGGTPMRTTMRLDGVQSAGLLRTAVDVTATNDPDARLDSLVIRGRVGERTEIVFDRSRQTVFHTDNTMNGRWQQFIPADLLAGTGTDALDALFDSFATGPITPAAVGGGVVVAADGLVRLHGGVLARPYQVTVPAASLQPYGLLLLANVYERTVDSGRSPAEIAFDVYVTDQPALELVAARFEVDNIVYLLQQFFDRRPANVVVGLPAADAIIDSADAAP